MESGLIGRSRSGSAHLHHHQQGDEDIGDLSLVGGHVVGVKARSIPSGRIPSSVSGALALEEMIRPTLSVGAALDDAAHLQRASGPAADVAGLRCSQQPKVRRGSGEGVSIILERISAGGQNAIKIGVLRGKVERGLNGGGLP